MGLQDYFQDLMKSMSRDQILEVHDVIEPYLKQVNQKLRLVKPVNYAYHGAALVLGYLVENYSKKDFCFGRMMIYYAAAYAYFYSLQTAYLHGAIADATSAFLDAVDKYIQIIK